MDDLSRGHGQPGLASATPVTAAQLSLVAYARKHRYRMRNLHDGGPVPPARRKRDDTRGPGYTGASDRWEAIVGSRGYVAMDGNRLTVFLTYKSARGVNGAVASLKELGAEIAQVGDAEVGATVPVECIEEILKLIRVSKLPPGDVSRFRPQ